ncbi:MAG TPA: tRNA preQ1(34) S-adenosylmethionine ribosyltransferase-isomerase QueA [Deltaproteobacteria bacterium]|nr:tRNA preQ1(34) S-adenosylmethionine ribosyltransferase-isomerase QueA [Deltaproteobacteria bacterium]
MSHRLSDYDYVFPPELVAQQPLPERGRSKMLVLKQNSAEIIHSNFNCLKEFLRDGDLIVVNDTQVLAARLHARKASGGKVEIFLLRSLGKQEWEVFFSPTRGLREGLKLPLLSQVEGELVSVFVTVVSLREGDFRIRFDTAAEEAQALEVFGEMPLPPYIRRPAPRAEDRERYQTVFAAVPGAVAAPTAGLHFDAGTREALAAQGVEWATLTLHVGAGTFLPVKTENIDEHRMHVESYEIPETTRQALRVCRERGGRVIAVGTTSLRALESWALTGRSSGVTDLFIRPGFRFQVVDALLTNFHQPKSTLLMLVSALVGRERILAAYREAVEKGYRLFSYGDCMLLLP